MTLPDYLEIRAASHSKWGEAATVIVMQRAAARIRRLEAQVRNLKKENAEK